MRRLLAVTALAAGAVALPATLAGAVGPEPPPVPSISLSQSEGPPEFTFDVTVIDCDPGEDVRFSYRGSAPLAQCDADGTVTSDPVFGAQSIPGTFPVTVSFFRANGSLPEVIDSCDETGGARPCTLTAEATVLPPTLSVTPTSGDPEFEFTMTVDNCGVPPITGGSVGTSDAEGGGQEVVFVVPGTDQSQETVCPSTTNTVTSETFTAPDEPGDHTVYALFPQSELRSTGQGDGRQDDLPPDCASELTVGCALYGTITVEEPPPVEEDEETTTTAAPTTEAPTTTAAPTTTEAPTTTDAGDASPPVETQPTLTLPATGPGSAGGLGGLAVALLAFGAILVVLASSRRSTVR